LFHVKPVWIRAAELSGVPLEAEEVRLMMRYREWLVTEGMAGGGIGPAEIERIDRRHLADSLLFASQIPKMTQTVWDVGSGVGLPGIPLAIALPDVQFLLIDRSGRRADLLRRVIRILELENCQVIEGEIDGMVGQADVIVSRASLPPDELHAVATRHLPPGGTAIAAGSWRERPQHQGWVTIEIPPHVLDQTVWLLIMRRE
jgi:16S rRNA (guanine527-N7)-methyltransferase